MKNVKLHPKVEIKVQHLQLGPLFRASVQSSLVLKAMYSSSLDCSEYCPL
jgi:hypothetical protein